MSDNARELLLRELREAIAERIADGTDPDELSADLLRRLRRIRRMEDEEAWSRPGRSSER